jgi:hypothetical protein
MKILRSLTAMAAVVAAALTVAAQARADAIDFFLNTAEGGATITPTVEVIVTGTTGSLGDYTAATVELEALSGTINSPAIINVNGDFSGTYTYGTVTDPTEHSGGSVTGTQSEDTFGEMSAGSAGGLTGDTTFTFTLTAEGGNSWADAAAVLIPTCPNTESTPGPGCGGYGVSGASVGYSTSEYSHGFEAVTGAQDAGYYPTPAPPIGHGLPGILAVAGVFFAAGLLERSRKRLSAGTAIGGVVA